MALRSTGNVDPDKPGLEFINMPWGFRLRPADMKEDKGETLTEWALTFLGGVLLAQCVWPVDFAGQSLWRGHDRNETDADGRSGRRGRLDYFNLSARVPP